MRGNCPGLSIRILSRKQISLSEWTVESRPYLVVSIFGNFFRTVTSFPLNLDSILFW